MKRILVTASLCVALACGVSVAMAADGAALYKPCVGCHGDDGSKRAMGVGNPVKGQKADVLFRKLKGYVDGSYGGAKKSVMTNFLKRYSDEEMKAMADYMATL